MCIHEERYQLEDPGVVVRIMLKWSSGSGIECMDRLVLAEVRGNLGSF